MFYLLARSISPSVVEVDTEDSTKNEQTDFLEANIIKMATIEVFVTPALVSAFIVYSNLLTIHSRASLGATWLGDTIMYFQFIQGFSIFFLNFIAVYRYKASKLRNKYLPYLHLTLVALIFMILPTVTVLIVAFGLLTDEVWNTAVGVWSMTYALTMLQMPIWSWFMILPVYKASKEEYEENM
jgi:hypothetical protein